MPRVSPRRPVLRWLAGLSSPATPQSSAPPSPSLASLAEAMREPLPAPPVLARPPPALLPDVKRAPPFLDNLARATLPTASLSPPLSVSSSLSRPPSPSHAPVLVNHSTPAQSSLDSLRSLSSRDHGRSFSTSSAATFVASTAGRAPSPTATLSRWWFQSENKENVNTLLNLDDRAQTHPQRQHKLRKKYRSPKNPVVFCHGLLGFDSVTIGPAIAPMQVTHWRGIKEVLEENGTEVLITRVPATSSPVDRAKVLEQTISKIYPGRSVHLVGHSMGGLDCRYLTTHLTHRNFNVLSITTIATPHRGSSFADHFLSTVGPTRMPSILSLLELLPNGGGDGKAFQSLTIESMRKFNEETPNVEGVRYFSWGAVYEPGLIDTWKWPHSVILEKEGPNDGLVSVESSKWGTYLGTLQHVNHLDLVGWINTARYKWAEMMGKEIKFRPATFYLGIADMLAGEVERMPREDEPEPRHEHDVRKHEEEVREELSETIREEGDSGKGELPEEREQDAHSPRVTKMSGKTVVDDTAAGSGVELQEPDTTPTPKP
ncbi:putative PGAP1-like protein [Lyophyllum shimeji]|uniref:GPI inositol-deacylase n=1 Tax=Lyophyllum shimeji TaxID=47721 RepID=A0A9P3PHN2_LYOSH|nr:putative PGAP1-like protein [Lyophyllum shimeji]